MAKKLISIPILTFFLVLLIQGGYGNSLFSRETRTQHSSFLDVGYHNSFELVANPILSKILHYSQTAPDSGQTPDQRHKKINLTRDYSPVIAISPLLPVYSNFKIPVSETPGLPVNIYSCGLLRAPPSIS